MHNRLVIPGTVDSDDRLSRYLIDLRKGRGSASEDEIQLMNDLVEEFGSFPELSSDQSYDSSADTNGNSTKREVVVSLYLAMSNVSDSIPRYSQVPPGRSVLISLTNFALRPQCHPLYVLSVPPIQPWLMLE